VATIRDVAAYAENAHRPLYILTLDFQHAFDSIVHEYLFTILCSYGLSNQFVTLLRNLYADATSCVQINGHLCGPIPIRRGVRQGCPLSMALFTMCLQPFITMLRHRLPGVRIGRSSNPVSVVAYADDITVFLTTMADFHIVQDTIQQFERASGVRLNPRKSRVLPIGRWPAPNNFLSISSQHHVKILGVHFGAPYDRWSLLLGLNSSRR